WCALLSLISQAKHTVTKGEYPFTDTNKEARHKRSKLPKTEKSFEKDVCTATPAHCWNTSLCQTCVLSICIYLPTAGFFLCQSSE
ncbi:MAG: hypothetical protein ACI4PQ_05605, partial [Butyricicoccaceae bacterium]